MGPPALQIGPGVTPYDSQLSTPRHATRHSSGGPDSPAGLRSHQLRGSFSDFNTPPSGGSSISHAGSLMSPGGLLSPSIVMSPGGHLVSVSPVSLSLNHYGVELAHTNNPSAGPALWDGSPSFGIPGCLSCPTRAFTRRGTSHQHSWLMSRHHTWHCQQAQAAAVQLQNPLLATDEPESACLQLCCSRLPICCRGLAQPGTKQPLPC